MDILEKNPKMFPQIQRGLFKWMDFHISIKNDDIYLTCKGIDKLSEKEQAINQYAQ